MGMIENSVSSLYLNNSPAFNNLYTVEIYNINSSGYSKGLDDTINNYFKYHAESVNFQGESLTLERNEVTKKFSFASSGTPYRRTDELTIKWAESNSLEVKKYHENWISNFYDRQNDHYLSVDNSHPLELRYRQIRIILPRTSGQDNVIIFDKVIPKLTPGLDLEWGSSGNIIKHNVTYYVENWRYSSTDSLVDTPIVRIGR